MSNSDLLRKYSPKINEIFNEVLEEMKFDGENPKTGPYFKAIFEICLSSMCTNVLNYGIDEDDTQKAKLFAAQYVHRQLLTILMGYVVDMSSDKEKESSVRDIVGQVN